MAGLNFGELVKDAEFSVRGQLLPEGTYTAKVTEPEYKESAAGNPMVKLTWVIAEGSEAGAKVFDNIVIPAGGNDERAKKAINRFFGYMACLGLSKEFFLASPSPQQLAQNLDGRRADIVVRHEEWNGKTRAKRAFINPPSVPGSTSPGPLQVGGFAPTPVAPARPAGGFTPPPLGALMNKPAAPPAPAAAPAAPPAPVEDDPHPVDF